MKAGLLGRKLGHSFSPQIHAMLGDYSYELFEVEPEDLGQFLREDAFDALNVTIPYKRDVMPYCSELTDAAQGVGSVNTIVRKSDGTLLGDNTDAAGFAGMLSRVIGDVQGKKALILGSGGASLAVRYALKLVGAEPIITVSRTGEDNYDNIEKHADAAVLVNATPVGMYPKNDDCPLDISRLPELEAVLDLIYNPARTRIIQAAEQRGIPCIGGLYMLVEQARRAAERFTDSCIPVSATETIYRKLRRDTENIVLIGMPGCGKTTVGNTLALTTGRIVIDADKALEARIGIPIPEFINTRGEDAFRKEETETLRELGAKSGIILSTGGGCVTREENYSLLHQNGRIYFLKRDLSLLPTDGRPLSQRNSLESLLQARLPKYNAFADAVIENMDTIEASAERIKEDFYENTGR